MLGDNPDALYYTAPVRADHSYRVTGNMAGCVYLSFTVELGSADGGYSTQTAGVLRDADFDMAPTAASRSSSAVRPRGQLAGAPGGRVRAHRALLLRGSRPGGRRPEPARPTDDRAARAARSARRRGTTRRSRRVPPGHRRSCAAATLEQAKPGEREQPSWVSSTPNVFPLPEVPGDFAFAAFDAAYSMAPYVIAPDEALVITGRWPECRFANVALWNRYLQTYDFAYRPAGRNRANTNSRPMAASASCSPTRIRACRTGSTPRVAVSDSCSGGSSCPKARSRRRRRMW